MGPGSRHGARHSAETRIRDTGSEFSNSTTVAQCASFRSTGVYSIIPLLKKNVYLNNVELPVLLRGGAHGGGGVAVVGIPERYDVVGAGVQPRHHNGELVGLRAGVGEEDNLCIIETNLVKICYVHDKKYYKRACIEIAGHLRGQRLGEVGDDVVEVEHGGVLQAPGLRDHRVHDVRVAVAAAHGGDAGERVQVAPAVLVIQVLPLSFHDVQLHKSSNNNMQHKEILLIPYC